MFYEKFTRGNNLFNSNSTKTTEIACESTIFPMSSGRSTDSKEDERLVTIDVYLESIQKIYTHEMIALEAEEDEVPDDTGSDDPFGGNNDTESSDFGDDPFTSGESNDLDSDPFAGGDDGGDPFGTSDDGSSESKSKKKVIDRDEAIKEEYNMSSQIRKIFPERLLNLRSIIDNNIENVEANISDNPKADAILREVIKEYKFIKDLIEQYAEVIMDKTYEDIFEMYVNIHSNLKKLRDIVIKVNRKVD